MALAGRARFQTEVAIACAVAVAPLPRAPQFVEGVINRRGWPGESAGFSR